LSKKKKKITINLEINKPASTLNLETKSFMQDDSSSDKSSIDLFWDNVVELNKLLGNITSNNAIGILLLLGYVSAVEGYFRSILSEIINIHPNSRKLNLKHNISYGAALFTKSDEVLSKFLFEEAVFASKDNIYDTIKKHLGITKGDLSNEFLKTVDDFEKVCQLRHCAVHRFGILGVKNAIKLDYDDHINKIGKFIKLDTGNLDDISAVCTNLVKVANNNLYECILAQTVNGKNGYEWKWDLRKKDDKMIFEKYHMIFYSQYFSNLDKYSLKKQFHLFRDKFNDR
jgi:hypothetical protein